MPVVPMREILDRAFTERYGVAAINVVDDLSLEAVLAAATELAGAADRPDVAEDGEVDRRQAVLRDVARAGRRGAGPGDAAPRPLPGPRVDLDLPADRLELGAVRRLRARRRREHAPDDRGRRRGRTATARRSRARSRACSASRTASAPTRPARCIRSRSRPSSSQATGIYSFAPAIGTAHGLYKAEPHLMPERVTEIVELHPIPQVLHGGTGLTEAQFTDLIARGCAKVNISTALKIAFVDSHREYLEANPGKNDPPSMLTPRARGGQGRWRRTTSASSARPAARRRRRPRPSSARAHLRLRRRARRHRARRAPPGVQPDVRRGRPRRRLGRGGVRPPAADRRRQGADRARCFVDADDAARRDPRPAQAQDRASTRRWSAPASSRPGPGSPGSSTRRSPPAGRSRSPRPRPRSRSARCSSTWSARRTPRTSPSSPATSCPPRSPTRRSTCSRCERARARRRATRS